MVNLAGALSSQGKHEQALLRYKQACTTYQATLGSGHPETQACLKHYADSQRQVDEQASINKERKSAEAGFSCARLVPKSEAEDDIDV